MMVAPERCYVVLAGIDRGRVVPEADTCVCDAVLGGCDGTGRVLYYKNHLDYYDERCGMCGGLGRVYGYPDDRAPTRLALVEDTAGRAVGAERPTHGTRASDTTGRPHRSRPTLSQGAR